MTPRTLLLASTAHVGPVFDTGALAVAPPRYRGPETAAGAAKSADMVRTAAVDELEKRSPAMQAMVEYWDLTDAIVDGHAAVKLAGKLFLPMFPGEPLEKYNFRVENSKFTNIFRDIVEGLASKPFEQEVSLIKEEGNNVPEEAERFVENVDGAGGNLTEFASLTFFNAIASAITWIFIDYPPDDGRVRSVADQKRLGRRPFWSHVLGRNVRDATVEMIDGSETLTYIRIFEPGTPDHVREFWYRRVEVDANGRETAPARVDWKLWVKTDQANRSGSQYVVETEGTLRGMDQIPLVPFMVGRRDGRTFKLFPAMRDAADLQRQLFKSESGLEFAKVITAFPMLSASGVKPKTDEAGNPVPIATGPNVVLYAPHDNSGNAGEWKYIEPNATSLRFLAEDIKEMKSDLRELGRQPLTAQSGNVTVIASARAASKAKSAVGAWALGLKNALENAMVITNKWMAIDRATYDPQVFVYTEFDNFTEGKDLDALAADRDRKDISQETYWSEMKRRGVYSPEFDPETERQRLLLETPGDGEDTTEE